MVGKTLVLTAATIGVAVVTAVGLNVVAPIGHAEEGHPEAHNADAVFASSIANTPPAAVFGPAVEVAQVDATVSDAAPAAAATAPSPAHAHESTLGGSCEIANAQVVSPATEAGDEAVMAEGLPLGEGDVAEDTTDDTMDAGVGQEQIEVATDDTDLATEDEAAELVAAGPATEQMSTGAATTEAVVAADAAASPDPAPATESSDTELPAGVGGGCATLSMATGVSEAAPLVSAEGMPDAAVPAADTTEAASQDAAAFDGGVVGGEAGGVCAIVSTAVTDAEPVFAQGHPGGEAEVATDDGGMMGAEDASAESAELAAEEPVSPSVVAAEPAAATPAPAPAPEPEPAPAPEPEPAPVAAAPEPAATATAPAPKPEPAKPAAPAKPKPAPKLRAAPPQVKKAWWPAANAGKLNLLYAGEASFTKAIALLFDGEFTSPESANAAIKVKDQKGRTVDGRWLVASNPRMLLFSIEPGLYTVEVGNGLTDKNDRTISAASSGPVFIP